MMDGTDKMAALDWSLPEIVDDEIDLDLDLADGSDGAVWEWNGSRWVAVLP